MVTFTGNETGTKNTNYTYSAMATDADGHDISYSFGWDDGTIDMTEFVANGTTYDITHTWTAAGVYQINANATDDYPEEGNGSVSGNLYLTVLIDAHIIDDPTNDVDGYLTDDDADGTYDNFHNNKDDSVSAVGYEDGYYLIDTDGDGEYDYKYDPETGTGEPIVIDDGTDDTTDETTEDNTMYYVAAIVIIIVLIILFGLATRKKKK
jgi:hypothetical protein